MGSSRPRDSALVISHWKKQLYTPLSEAKFLPTLTYSALLPLCFAPPQRVPRKRTRPEAALRMHATRSGPPPIDHPRLICPSLSTDKHASPPRPTPRRPGRTRPSVIVPPSSVLRPPFPVPPSSALEILASQVSRPSSLGHPPQTRPSPRPPARPRPLTRPTCPA